MPKIVFLVPEGLLLVVWSSVWLWDGLVCGSKVFTLRCVGLGQLFGELGWVGLKKLDPWTTLLSIGIEINDLERRNDPRCTLYLR